MSKTAQEIIKFKFQDKTLDVPFVATVNAPEDHVAIHPLMLQRVFSYVGDTHGYIDILKSEVDLQPQVGTDIAWLLGAKFDSDGAPIYLNHVINGGNAIMTTDIEDAIRFSRKQDAQRIADDIHAHFGLLTATEHVWL